MADSLKINPPPAKKKRREQSYSSKYGEEFSFITNSKVSSLHAFCKPCRKDINISHGGRLDIVQHDLFSSASSLHGGGGVFLILFLKSWQLCFPNRIVHSGVQNNPMLYFVLNSLNMCKVDAKFL